MKKFLSLLLVVVLTATLAVGGTLAYLTIDDVDSAQSNVFTVGDIDISLDEDVAVFGEGGEVKETEDGAEYIEVMPGDYLKKEVTVSNDGKTDAYVAVTVLLNNADKINAAIDEVYENDPYKYGVAQIQTVYDNVFDGWGINYNPRPNKNGVNDARGVIDGTYGLPEHVLQVDFAKTVKGSTVIGAGNWFVAGKEKAGQYWVDGPSAYDGYYTKDMKDYGICYTYYMLLPAGESSTLFNGLNVPAEFVREQLAMFNGLEINVTAAAIQADNIPGEGVEKAKNAFAALNGDFVGWERVTVETTAEFEAALAAAEESDYLHIILNGDVEWVTDGHHDENDVTKAAAVLVDGQNKYTLTAVGAGVTPIGDTEAPLTLRNLKVVDNSVSYNEASWELSYLEMGGKVLTCENVDFADPIQVVSDKATFTDCSFVGHNDKNSTSTTQYGVWVYNGDSEYINCTFTGTRGMKICDRYAGEVGTVTIDGCTFSFISEKPGVCIDDHDTKDMKITIKNSTFIGCQAGDHDLYVYETDNTVPTVENNKVIMGTTAANNDELDVAIEAGNTAIMLGDGTYVIPDSAKGKTLTFVGNGYTKIIAQNDGAAEGNCDYSLDGANVTFENVTITTTGT